MEDLSWQYDSANWMSPWQIRAEHSGMVDLMLTPTMVKTTRLNLGLLSTGGTCVFGRWSGVIRFDGHEVQIDNLVGWAEEFAHRW